MATSHGAIPFDLNTTMSSSDCRPGSSPGDDRVELLYLEPVELPGGDGLDQVARLEPGVLERVAADERRPGDHLGVELPGSRVVRADRADEGAVREPVAAEHGILRRRRGDDDVARRRPRPDCSATSAPCRSANASARARVRLETTTRSIDGTAARIAASWDSACQPAPIRPRLFASGRARCFAATPLAAPVRTCPSRSAAISAVSEPSSRPEQADDELQRLSDDRIALEPGHAEPTVSRRHHGEVPALDREPPARHQLHLGGGDPQEAVLDHRHGLAGRDERCDVVLREPERHGGSLEPARRRTPATLPLPSARSSGDRALPCGGRGRTFESCRAHRETPRKPGLSFVR